MAGISCEEIFKTSRAEQTQNLSASFFLHTGGFIFLKMRCVSPSLIFWNSAMLRVNWFCNNALK